MRWKIYGTTSSSRNWQLVFDEVSFIYIKKKKIIIIKTFLSRSCNAPNKKIKKKVREKIYIFKTVKDVKRWVRRKKRYVHL